MRRLLSVHLTINRAKFSNQEPSYLKVLSHDKTQPSSVVKLVNARIVFSLSTVGSDQLGVRLRAFSDKTDLKVDAFCEGACVFMFVDERLRRFSNTMNM